MLKEEIKKHKKYENDALKLAKSYLERKEYKDAIEQCIFAHTHNFIINKLLQLKNEKLEY